MPNNFANSINSSIGASNSGATNTLTVTNPSNTASSQALLNLTVGGASSGDAFTTYTVAGTTNWSQGVDNSASDAFVISASTALGTTNVLSSSTAGEIIMPLQPAFLAYLSAVVNNVTGDNTTYLIVFDSEIFDQNSDFDTSTGIFTAPITGRYQFSYVLGLAQVAVANTDLLIQLQTSNLTNLQTTRVNPATLFISGGTFFSGSLLLDMDAADVAKLFVTVAGGTKIVDVNGSATAGSWFSGFLAC